MYAEYSDDDLDSGSSEASTKEMEVPTPDTYNINDKLPKHSNQPTQYYNQAIQ